jgi:hypothetical protein
MHDDIPQNSPTTSDNVRPSPTQSDHDGHSPTMSATRSDQHTLTTSEVVQLFENAALPREKRSIERYCEQGKLDCFKDPDELRYYITRASAEQLIGHLKELKARHAQPDAAASAPTDAPQVRQGPTSRSGAGHVKPETPEQRGSETAIEEYKQRIKELEEENFSLKVSKQVAETVVTKLGGYIKDDREHYTKLIQQTTKDIAKYSRRLGQLETAIKQRRLPVPDIDATDDDKDEFDDAAIEAEFSEGPTPATDQPT